jgi:hypothetical protein
MKTKNQMRQTTMKEMTARHPTAARAAETTTRITTQAGARAGIQEKEQRATTAMKAKTAAKTKAQHGRQQQKTTVKASETAAIKRRA